MPPAPPQQPQQQQSRSHKGPFTDAEIKEAFEAFDLDHNNFIGAAEIRHVLINIGEQPTDAEVDEMVKMADRDGITFFVPLAQPNATCPSLSQCNFMPRPETYDSIWERGVLVLFCTRETTSRRICWQCCN